MMFYKAQMMVLCDELMNPHVLKSIFFVCFLKYINTIIFHSNSVHAIIYLLGGADSSVV